MIRGFVEHIIFFTKLFEKVLIFENDTWIIFVLWH